MRIVCSKMIKAVPCPRALVSLQETQSGFHRRKDSAETPRSSTAFAEDKTMSVRATSLSPNIWSINRYGENYRRRVKHSTLVLNLRPSLRYRLMTHRENAA